MPAGVRLCEVIHRLGGRASLASGPWEQAVLEGEGEALWAQKVFTLMDAASVSWEKPAPPQGRDSSIGL